MYTKLLLTSSAIILGLAGVALTFLPQEIAQVATQSDEVLTLILIQVIGAMYFAFAVLNWMSRKNPIGGIYNRPLLVANTSHFLIVALALVKRFSANPDFGNVSWLIAAVYILFALAFGRLFFHHPEPK